MDIVYGILALLALGLFIIALQAIIYSVFFTIPAILIDTLTYFLAINDLIQRSGENTLINRMLNVKLTDGKLVSKLNRDINFNHNEALEVFIISIFFCLLTDLMLSFFCFTEYESMFSGIKIFGQTAYMSTESGFLYILFGSIVAIGLYYYFFIKKRFKDDLISFTNNRLNGINLTLDLGEGLAELNRQTSELYRSRGIEYQEKNLPFYDFLEKNKSRIISDTQNVKRELEKKFKEELKLAETDLKNAKNVASLRDSAVKAYNDAKDPVIKYDNPAFNDKLKEYNTSIISYDSLIIDKKWDSYINFMKILVENINDLKQKALKYSTSGHKTTAVNVGEPSSKPQKNIRQVEDTDNTGGYEAKLKDLKSRKIGKNEGGV